MTSILKNMYVDRLDDIVNKHNNTYHRISKYKNIFAKGYVPNWSEDIFVI